MFLIGEYCLNAQAEFSGLMVENTPRGEQLFTKAKEGASSPEAKGSLAGKAAKMLSGVRGLFVKGASKSSPDAHKGKSLLPSMLSAQKLDLKSINQALMVILTGLIALTGYVIFRQPPNISSVAAAVSKIKFEDLQEGVITPFGELAFYLDQIKQRDIFNEYQEYVPPPPVVEVPPPPPPPPPPKVTIQEKAKNLKLMGISWGDDAKVIIRNETTQEVFFLEEGHKIKGTDITVKEVQQEAVILVSEGDEMKMK